MNSSEKNIYNALPKLPHFNFPELNELPANGRREFCYFLDGERKVKAQATFATPAEKEKGCGIPVNVILGRFPQWLTLDRKVLRFFAYYEEEVLESTVEKNRVRKVCLYFNLNNGIIGVTETPFVKNSGLRRGLTVAPSKAPGIDVFSLCIGATLHVRGIDYHLVDCDAFTREFYEVMGMPQPEPLPYPFDAFEYRALQPPPPMGEGHVDLRNFVEVKAAKVAGTHASLLTPEERAKTRDFFLHDREVLLFDATWDKRKFRIQYYIADGTISVMFEPADNDGRDRHPVFVRRTKVPRDTKALLVNPETVNRPQGPMQKFIGVEDLGTGKTVDIFAREFYIYDCDLYTREFYKKRGIDMPSFPRPFCEHDMADAKKNALSKIFQQKAQKTAPLAEDEKDGRNENGLGHSAIPAADSDTATERPKFGASAMQFEDHITQKNSLKMNRFAQDVFRFGARMIERCPEDIGRRFIVCYHLADDTMSIYEVVINNSGHLGGKIFARRQVASITDPRSLKVGSSVCLEGITYVLEEMDERTKKYIERGFPDIDETYYHTKDLLNKVKQELLRRFSRTTDIFRYYASSSSLGLNSDNVRELFIDNGIQIKDTELQNVMELVDTNHDGWVDLADMTERILNQQFMSGFQPRSSIPRGTPIVVRGPIRSAEMIARRSSAQQLGEEALRHFFILMEARRTLMLRAFQDASVFSYDSKIGAEEFRRCVTDRLRLSLSDEEMGALIYRFFYSPGIPKWITEKRLSLEEIKETIRM